MVSYTECNIYMIKLFGSIPLYLADFLLRFCVFYSDWISVEVTKLKYIYICLYYSRIYVQITYILIVYKDYIKSFIFDTFILNVI